MKKHSLAEFFKSKSFYALLCVGALAIVAITMVSMNRASENEGNKNLVDLNEPIVSDVAEGGDILDPVIDTPDINNPTSSTAANNEDSTSQTEVAKTTPDNLGEINEPITDGSFLEFDIVDDPNAVATNEQTGESAEADAADTQTAEVGNSVEETATTEPLEEVQEVMKPETLHFEAEAGLLWPVTGNVLMNYSIDKVIYHQTLEQFKINPAVLIDAEVGSEVLSAAKGIITTVEHNDETGLTVTAAIGNGYSLVYGQLQDVAVKVGDTVEEGQVLGTIAKPTKFYSLEGSNLYFQVLKDEKTMNPMLLLR
jgi:murein DD-endopeptidase MepM/ murein hydrolase activator NlpD